ncbi:MAG: hypothetical protein IT323_02700 [Anaerolineae bacterium]|nr:hypothetical protein [Anaerolineae bacterium]
MRPFPVLLAHGALGPLDEILLIVVAALFVVMFAAPTVMALIKKGREGESGESDGGAPPAAPDVTPDAASADPKMPETGRRDHFRLD